MGCEASPSGAKLDVLLEQVVAGGAAVAGASGLAQVAERLHFALGERGQQLALGHLQTFADDIGPLGRWLSRHCTRIIVFLIMRRNLIVALPISP